MLRRTLGALALLFFAGTWGCSRPLSEQELRERDIDQPIRGFVDPEGIRGASLAIVQVNDEGLVARHEFKNGQVFITQWGPEDVEGDTTATAHKLTPDDLEAWADVVNVIVRDELRLQGDVKSQTGDVQDITYEFRVGEHQGKFRLVNASPDHLQVFQMKVRLLLNQVYSTIYNIPYRKPRVGSNITSLAHRRPVLVAPPDVQDDPIKRKRPRPNATTAKRPVPVLVAPPDVQAGSSKKKKRTRPGATAKSFPRPVLVAPPE